MNLLQCITELRDCEAMSILGRAVYQLEDWLDRYGDHTRHADPEEYAKTRRILGLLIDLQADEIKRSVREGEVMNIRRAQEAANDTDDFDPPPAVSAAQPLMTEIAA